MEEREIWDYKSKKRTEKDIREDREIEEGRRNSGRKDEYKLGKEEYGFKMIVVSLILGIVLLISSSFMSDGFISKSVFWLGLIFVLCFVAGIFWKFISSFWA